MSLHHHKSSPLLSTLVLFPNNETFTSFLMFLMLNLTPPLVNLVGSFQTHSLQVSLSINFASVIDYVLV
jgi:hypothetical protein